MNILTPTYKSNNVQYSGSYKDVPPAEEMLSDQQVIELISNITGDEFCEDLNMTLTFMEEHDIKFSHNQLMNLLKEAHGKLSDIYVIAHSHNRQSSCYKVHDSWRKRALHQYEELVK